MPAIVAGIYKQGKIELLEQPTGIREGPVRVVVIGEEPRPLPNPLTFGKYATGRLSMPEDFATAEWRGEAEFDEPDGR